MPKLLCSACEVELRCHRNGVHVIEHASFGPYKLWEADEWICPKCKHKVVAGFAQKGTEHWEEPFGRRLRSVQSEPELIRNSYEVQG